MQDIIRLGIISDTHMPRAADTLPDKVIKGLEGVDMILHAGDITEENVLEELGRIAPIKAVAGNMDGFDFQEIEQVADILHHLFWVQTIGVVLGTAVSTQIHRHHPKISRQRADKITPLIGQRTQ